MKKIIMTVAAVLAAGVFAMPAGFTDDFDAALKKAAAENKTVLALFTGSDWCIWCKRLESEVLSQKAFSDEVGKTFVPVFLDFPSNKALVKKSTLKRNCELAEKYSILGFPTVLLLNSQGEVVYDTGYREGGAEKYLVYVNHLLQFAPELKKYIKPYEKRLKALANRAARRRGAAQILAEMKELRKDLVAEVVPKVIAEDKDDLLKRIDEEIEFLTKAAKGELP